MLKRGLLALVLVTCVAPTSALATPIVASFGGGPLVLNGSDFGTAGTAAAPWLVSDAFTALGPGILEFSASDGQPLAAAVSPFVSGSWFTRTITNNTGVAWTSFELELLENLSRPSGEGDGLSFAQGAALFFSSNVFQSYTRVDTHRDYLNFTGGTVLPGESVTFNFAITDNSPHSFYLVHTPNKGDFLNAPRVVNPEPMTLLLLGTGLTGVAYRLRRRR